MLLSLRAAWLPLALTSVLIAGAAGAQATRPDPQDADAPVPVLNYSPPLAGYRAFVDQEVTSWRDSNDTAGRIGGWRVYAREASQPASGPQPSPGAGETPKAGANGHNGHHRGAP